MQQKSYDIKEYLANEQVIIRLALNTRLAKSVQDFITKYAVRFRALYRLYGRVTLDMLK